MPSEDLFILPGEMAFLRDPSRITTLLGSCVAVCLHDQRRGWGGLNHYMVPDQTGGLTAGKIGALAIDGLLRLATMAGCAPVDLTAQLYGGASMISGLGAGSVGMSDIGARNIIIARSRLAALGIPVIGEQVGGTSGLRIRMDTATGAVDVVSLSRAPGPDRQPPRPTSNVPKTRVLVVDDSPLVRQILTRVIASSDDLEVVGEAEDPFVARERILDLDPDVLSLDLIMPKLDGLAFLRRLMQYKPIPTVVVSTIAKPGSPMRAKVLEAGAIDAIDKEDLHLYQGTEVAGRILLPALRKAARAVVTARPPGAGP